MDWQSQLISLYLTVCELYRRELRIHVQRFAPHANLRFTDEEVITLYLFGIVDKQREIKTLYTQADRYWRDGFPHLPSYGAYVQRLNRLAAGKRPRVTVLTASGRDGLSQFCDMTGEVPG
ncbi:transposase [Methylocaldum marinum]|uniref:Transposase n=1 Tax=Methylocaldum marinum TaxID=1432792 RepID=A0A250KQC6_9GAMM|nr:hypothetical protein [Methylocaldum marinum]BBA33797.1 transposase [Methylocaldum marinum]